MRTQIKHIAVLGNRDEKRIRSPQGIREAALLDEPANSRNLGLDPTSAGKLTSARVPRAAAQ
jgi:hypothetical protein